MYFALSFNIFALLICNSNSFTLTNKLLIKRNNIFTLKIKSVNDFYEDLNILHKFKFTFLKKIIMML